MIRLGLLSFSDGRERVHRSLAPDISAHQARIQRMLEETGEIQIVPGQEIVHSAATARCEARRLAALHLDGVIFNLPVFSFPNYCVIATQLVSGPYLLLGPQDARYPGLGGLLGAAGALSEVGVTHERLWVDLNDERVPGQILTFARAAAAATRLRGQVYGLIGGRSIGMGTGAAPAELWQRLFGVDVDHVDESEIVRLAGQVPPSEVEAARSWLEKQRVEIVFDGRQLTPEKLDLELRSYVALKEIVTTRQFDLVGLKCHFDMSEYFVVQCLGATLLNDPYDWNGPKEPVPLACEADSDGALTMQMLHLVSGKPSCLLDLRFFDRAQGVYVMPNCGAAPTWFAARSDDPAENLAHVRIVPSITKYAGGGAHVEFVFGPGEVTMARLSRSPAGYRMVIGRGETQQYAIREVVGTNPQWPHAFVRTNVSPEAMVQKMEANHLHLVAGDYRAELVALCRMLKVQPVLLDG
jgi:L-fucose isomerase